MTCRSCHNEEGYIRSVVSVDNQGNCVKCGNYPEEGRNMTQCNFQELQVLEASTRSLVIEAIGYGITTEAEAEYAHDLWAQLDTKIKTAETTLKEIDDPLKRSRSLLKKQFDMVADPMKDARDGMKALMLKWRKDVNDAADKANDARERQRDHIAETVAVRTGTDVETVKDRMPAPIPVQDAGRGFATSKGDVTYQRVQKWKVVDAEAIPNQHDGINLWKLDDGVITKLRRAAGEALVMAPPGIEFYYEETPRHGR